MSKRSATRGLGPRIAAWLTALLLGLFANVAAAQGAAEPMPLRVGLNEGPPLAYNDERGQPEGWLVRLTHALLDKGGVPYSLQVYPAARLLRQLVGGEANFSILVRVPSLEGAFLFSRSPLAVHELRVYRIGNTPAVHSLDDLKSRSVITLHGFSYAGFIAQVNDPQNRIRNESALNFKSGFSMLAHGRADYLLAYDSYVLPSDTAGIADLQYEVLHRVPFYLVLARNYPDAERTLSRLEALAKTIDVQAYIDGRR